MLNLLIIDKNLNNSIHLLNYISENNSQFKVHSITDNITDGIKILNTGSVDFTIIHVDDNSDSIINNLNAISNLYYEKYKNSIILISENTQDLFYNHYIYECLNSTENISLLFSKISELAKSKSKQMNNSILLSKINKELDFIGYNLSYIGTKYLSECISLIYNNYDYTENLNKTVYSIIAKKYHKNINNIKCNITSATNTMFYECDENKLKKYFNFYTVCKPKPKLVIYTVLSKLD